MSQRLLNLSKVAKVYRKLYPSLTLKQVFFLSVQYIGGEL